jgi:hypothetical protein
MHRSSRSGPKKMVRRNPQSERARSPDPPHAFVSASTVKCLSPSAFTFQTINVDELTMHNDSLRQYPLIDKYHVVFKRKKQTNPNSRGPTCSNLLMGTFRLRSPKISAHARSCDPVSLYGSARSISWQRGDHSSWGTGAVFPPTRSSCRCCNMPNCAAGKGYFQQYASEVRQAPVALMPGQEP